MSVCATPYPDHLEEAQRQRTGVSTCNQSQSAEICLVSHRHGANRMTHLSKKVVTSGIACNTISRKWGPTSVSQPYKPFDGSTSASVSLRSVEPSSKSPFEDQLSNLIDTVRNSRVERSETLLLLSVAMDWNPPLVAKVYQPSFAWCRRLGTNRMEHPPQKVVTSGVA